MTDRTQAMTTSATRTPWWTDIEGRGDQAHNVICAQLGAHGTQVVVDDLNAGYLLDPDERYANAALIVEAVNSYASLKARIAELEENERAYEATIGKKTFQEVADRIRELEGDLRRSREKLINMAADCHRSKWQFDLNEDYRPTAGAARDLILKAFRELHRIGDVAIKAYSDLHPKDPAP